MNAKQLLSVLFFSIFIFPIITCKSKKIIAPKYASDIQKSKIKEPLAFRHTIVIAADDQSEAKWGDFPWRRSLLAEAVAKLTGSKVIVIAFNLDEKGSFQDNRLLELNIGKQKNVVLMAKLSAEGKKFNHRFYYGRELFLSANGLRYDSKDAVFPYLALADRAAGIGFCSFFSDQMDNEADSFPLAVELNSAAYPTLPLAVLQISERISRKQIFAANGSIYIGKKNMSFSYINDMLNTFSGKEPKIYSFVDLLAGRMQPELWRGKIVVIGFHFKRTPLWPVHKKSMEVKRISLTAGRIESLQQWYQE